MTAGIKIKQMNLVNIIQNGVVAGVKALYDQDVEPSKVNINVTRKEFDGDYTVVVFPYTKAARKKPEQIGEELGQYLVEHTSELVGFNVIKGFLNVVVSDAFWLQFFGEAYGQKQFGYGPKKEEKVLVEYSSPNTNKPLHLGHIRNILLGWSCSKILEAAGYDVSKVQIVNDRGIHICKSMLAWEKYGNGETPESSGQKSDHLVGKYYVKFSQIEKEQKAALVAAGNEAGEPPILSEARDLLLKWEANDPETRALWAKLNQWVYDGFAQTYQELGVHFDKNYYESETYLVGKDRVLEGLEKGVFYRKEDGSVWIDLEDAKLDHKLVLRSDGTSVYMTQDIGTAMLRYDDFKMSKLVYVVGDEQNYHFKVLFEIMKRLGAPYADGLKHLSYGMVDLPSGKMKSREGTVVDADELIAEVIEEARKGSVESGVITDLSPEEQNALNTQIGLAALKYFILKVNPQKRMLFDPKESVDLQGHTGPYIQNACVRARSILRKAKAQGIDYSGEISYTALETAEKDIIAQMARLPETIQAAAAAYDPSAIAAFCYDLAKSYHRFYHDYQILKADSPEAQIFRLQLCEMVARVLTTGMDLLGIEMPERM